MGNRESKQEQQQQQQQLGNNCSNKKIQDEGANQRAANPSRDACPVAVTCADGGSLGNCSTCECCLANDDDDDDDDYDDNPGGGSIDEVVVTTLEDLIRSNQCCSAAAAASNGNSPSDEIVTSQLIINAPTTKATIDEQQSLFAAASGCLADVGGHQVCCPDQAVCCCCSCQQFDDTAERRPLGGVLIDPNDNKWRLLYPEAALVAQQRRANSETNHHPNSKGLTNADPHLADGIISPATSGGGAGFRWPPGARLSRKLSDIYLNETSAAAAAKDTTRTRQSFGCAKKPLTLLEKVNATSSLIESAATAELMMRRQVHKRNHNRNHKQQHATDTKLPFDAPQTGHQNNSSGDSNKSKQNKQSEGLCEVVKVNEPPPPPPSPPSLPEKVVVVEDEETSAEQQQQQQTKEATTCDTDSCATSSTTCKKVEEHQQQQSECDKVKAKLKASDANEYNSSSSSSNRNYLDWNLITRKYKKMPTRHSSRRDKLCWQLQSSCLCRFLIVFTQTLFPIFTSFRDYNLPGDLITDLVAGSTVAVLHIPQGMAYGLLAGVDPIYGLYVSFVPVLVMALMSKSRHVSYGTFAILSMLLANACDLAKLNLGHQHQMQSVGSAAAAMATGRNQATEDEALVLVNNHRSETEQEITKESNLKAPSEWFVSSALLGSSSGGDEPLPMPSNIEILTCICLLVGLIQVTMSLLRLGILSLMFSDQLVSSFTAASAFHVITSQVPNLFDLTSPTVPNGLFKVCRSWWALLLRLLEGFNYYTAILSLASIMFLLLVKEAVEPLIRRRLCKSLTCLPSELCLMACIILSSWYWKFEQSFGIEVIGHVPTNLPAPRPPRVDLIPVVFQDALTIALVSFAMNLSLGQVYAKRNKYQLDPNQELFALGTSNVVGSFFSCFPCASSLSRSAVQSSLNVKSQVCSLFSCTIVVLIICYFAPILHDLPKSTLSCIIIVALKGILFQVRDFYANWRLSKLDAIVWITTFTSVLAFGVTYGLVLGIAASLFMVFVRLLNPNHSILGQLAGTEIYVDRNAFMDCHEIEQVKIFRFNSALCYLNRTMFKACIEKSLPMIYRHNTLASFYPASCGKYQQEQADNDKIKFLVIDCSALAYCDYSGAETLVDIVDELEEHKVQVYLAACPVKLINMIEKMKRTRVLEHNVHPTITDALNHAKYLRGRQMQQCSMLGNCHVDSCTCLQSVINGLP